jgi:hypothetical protein
MQDAPTDMPRAAPAEVVSSGVPETQPTPAKVPSTRIPNDLLGAVLDHDKASAYAAHMLAIKCSKGPSFVLNVVFCDKYHGISDRGFRQGMRVMRRAKVLEREQSGYRTFAKERLAQGGGNYVSVPDHLIASLDSDVLAFLLVVKLSPKALRPTSAARRIGLRSRDAARRLTEAACATGEVVCRVKRHGRVEVARDANVFSRLDQVTKNDTAKNDTAKNDRTHREMQDSTVDCKTSQSSERQSLYGTRSDERVPSEIFNSKEDSTVLASVDASFITLSDWKSGAFFQQRDMKFHGEPDLSVMSERGWAACLQRYAEDRLVPDQLTTPTAHRHASEIVSELGQSARYWDHNISPQLVMAGLACATAHAIALGKTIRSFGFIAAKLIRRADNGDDGWAFDLPIRIDRERFSDANALAKEAVKAMKTSATPVALNERHLLSTFEVEELAEMIAKHGRGVVIDGLNYVLNDPSIRPQEKFTVWKWHWFVPHIEAAAAARHQRQHATWTRQPPRRPRKPRKPNLPPY